jgi:enediyne biosynthesis protein E4
MELGVGRRWKRVGWAVAAVLALGGAAAGVEAWRFRRELEAARREIRERSMDSARDRLAALARSRPGWGGGEVDYWLGACEWSSGRREAALVALERVPPRSEFFPRAELFRAEAAMDRGRWREAEQHALEACHPGHDIPKGAFRWLGQLYRKQARFEETRILLESSTGEGSDADDLRTLRDLWVLDRGTVPLDPIREELDAAGRLAPDDDRVWLGKGRLATLAGAYDEAESWLRKCLGGQPDRAVWLAWRDWARAAGRPEEALRALRPLGDVDSTPAERLEWRAWLLGRVGDAEGERGALARWLDIEPGRPEALERMAELMQEIGEDDRAAEYRRRKARVDEALDRYGRLMAEGGRFAEASARLEMGRLAAELGRRYEARLWLVLARRLDPEVPGAALLLAQVDRSDAASDRSSPGTSSPAGPWEDLRARVEALHGGEVRAGPGSKIAFVDEAESAGLSFVYRNGETPIRQMPEALGGGVGLLDFDRDGWLDVYAVQGGDFPPKGASGEGDRLFRNRGDGTFEDVTARAGLGGGGHYGHGVTVGDYDNDGDPDLFVTRWRSYALFRNEGDGTFSDATEAAGLGGERGWPTSAAWADLDGDGDLDLYVCHYLKWSPDDHRPCRDSEAGAYVYCYPRKFASEPDHLFRNDGGRFADVTAEAGIADPDGRGLGVVAADLDDDGLSDLFVANDKTANYLFRNLGGLRFEEVGHECGVAANAAGGYQASMGVACGDLDGDGRIDLAVTNYYGESTTFYHHLGSGQFADRTSAIGLDASSRYLLGFGIAFPDVDNDGDLDVLSANGHLDPLPGVPYRMKTQLLVNRGGGTLRDATGSSPALVKPRLGRGMACGDLDNDGRMDAVLIDHNAPLVYLRNRTEPAGHSVTLLLEGGPSNRDAIGARVAVTAGGRTQVAHRIGGGDYQSADDPRLHFGLGAAGRVEEVEVIWPSGFRETWRDLAVDAGYRLREARGRPEPLAGSVPR